MNTATSTSSSIGVDTFLTRARNLWGVDWRNMEVGIA